MSDVLNSANGQIVIIAAHRYALGRHTYFVPATTEWLRQHWEHVQPNTRHVILRDTVEHLIRNTHEDMDRKEWFEFAQWAAERMSPTELTAVKTATAGEPWPL